MDCLVSPGRKKRKPSAKAVLHPKSACASRTGERRPTDDQWLELRALSPCSRGAFRLSGKSDGPADV